MKPRTNQSALRAIFGEGGVTLEPHLTGEAFRSRLLPLLLSSRKSDWGFCAIKGWRSFRQAPLYVQFNEEQNKSIENTDDIEDNIIFTPLKIEYDPIDVAKSLEPNYGHWRHVVLPEDYDYFLDLLLNNIGWTGEKRKILSVAITSILRDASDIKRRGAGAETITKLSNVAVDALVVQKSQNTIRDIWFGYEDLKEAKRKAESGLKDILGSGKATKISQKRNAALIEYIHFRISKNR